MKDFSYITNSSPAFIENMYLEFVKDPNSVDPELKKFFEDYDKAELALSPISKSYRGIKDGDYGKLDEFSDAAAIRSNTFKQVWPPKSGRYVEFPEVDRAGWFSPADARKKLIIAQRELVDRLCAQLPAE